MNLAAAYGQEYGWLKSKLPSDVNGLKASEDKAANAIANALKINPASKQRFRELTNAASLDNDLSVLAKDSVEVRKLLDLAALTVESIPVNAELYLDSVAAGKTPITLLILAGKHSVRVTLAGYKDWSEEQTLTSGPEVKVVAELQRS
jgi:hypothetical protein